MSGRVAGKTRWVVVILLGVAAAAVARQTAAPGDDPGSLTQLTVEGQVLEVKARRFVMDVTAASGFFMDDAVQQWRKPVCPLVAGLPPAEGHLVFDRLNADFASIGVPRGQVGCHPNFFFIVTKEPESVLKGAWKRNWNLFGDASPTAVEQYIRTRRPVRVWYDTALAGSDNPAVTALSVPALTGDPLFNQSGFANVPAITHDGNQLRARYTAMRDLLAVVAIVDPSELEGFAWTQVADYVAMTGLTRIAPDASVGSTPSILQLFTAAAGSRPAGLSNWDRSFLSDLYGTDPGWRGQRDQVSRLMVRDLQSAGR